MLFITFEGQWVRMPIFEFEIPNGSAFFRCMFFVNGRPPLLKLNMSEQDQRLGARQSVTSSYHQNQSSIRGSEGATREKKRILLIVSITILKSWEGNMPACRCVVQDCSNKSNPRIGISLHTPKSNHEMAKWKAFVRLHSSNFNPKGLFKICSVHFAPECFERPLHIEGAPRRLIAGSIPTIWKSSVEGTSSVISARSRRRVSKLLTFLKLWLSRGFSGRTKVTRGQRRAINIYIFLTFWDTRNINPDGY